LSPQVSRLALQVRSIEVGQFIEHFTSASLAVT
jgi:hypothetical protein